LLAYLILVSVVVKDSAVDLDDSLKSLDVPSFQSIKGDLVPLADNCGQVIFVGRTASFYGVTKQYRAYQDIWGQCKNGRFAGSSALSKDCRDQQPGMESMIKKICKVNPGVGFPVMSKFDIRGMNVHSFCKLVAQTLGSLAKPRWNFHKFLISRNGRLAEGLSAPTNTASKKFTQNIEAHLTSATGNRWP
jgi:glutathione peroxidase